MAPKKRPLPAIQGLGNQGLLNLFHTGIVYGLHKSNEFEEELSQVQIAQLVGACPKTVRLHLAKAEELLTTAQGRLDASRLGTAAAEEPDPDEDLKEDVVHRRKLVLKLLSKRSPQGFRVFRTARDVFEELLGHDIDVTLRTVQRDCTAVGFQYKARPRTSPLTEKRCATRLSMAQKMLNTMTDDDFERIVFSDESYVRCEKFRALEGHVVRQRGPGRG